VVFEARIVEEETLQRNHLRKAHLGVSCEQQLPSSNLSMQVTYSPDGEVISAGFRFILQKQ
jgi:hypothetical protein